MNRTVSPQLPRTFLNLYLILTLATVFLAAPELRAATPESVEDLVASLAAGRGFSADIASGALTSGGGLEAMSAGLLLGPGGPGLETRDGYGPFFLTRIDRSTGQRIVTAHPSRDWVCASQTAGGPIGGVIASLTWLGCRVDATQPAGETFDLIQVFVAVPGENAFDLETWVQSRLSDSIEDFRFVLRLDPSSLPKSGDDTFLMFGYDAWIPNPLAEVRFDNLNREHGHVQQAELPEDPVRGTGFIRDRLKTTDSLSLHTPDGGFLMYGMDLGNAASGWLFAGANGSEAAPQTPSFEFGYHHRMPFNVLPANGGGLIRVGPRFRVHQLPAQRPVESAWWEAVEAYRPFLTASGLLPPNPLVSQPDPAPWARDCLYTAWSVSPVGSPIDVPLWRKVARETARYYRQGLDPDARPGICPLLWGAYSFAPHVFRPRAAELLAALHVVGEQEGVAFYPGVYMDPSVLDWSRAEQGLRAAVWISESGQPILINGNGIVHEDHPAILGEALRAIGVAYEAGARWVYHDAPFGESGSDPGGRGGPHRSIHQGKRIMIDAMATELEARGGGVVGIEQGRLGLRAIQSANSSLSQPMYLGSDPRPFSSALWHDYHVGGFFGDILGESFTIELADSRYDPTLGICPGCEPGLPQNDRHIPRLALDGAVYGRMPLDPAGSFWQIEQPTTSLQQWQKLYVETMRRGWHLRLEVPALRTGKMLPPPSPGDGTVQVAGRLITSFTPPVAAAKRVAKRTLPKTPVAFYQDLEHPGEFVLVMGNSDINAGNVTFAFSADEYSEMGAGTFEVVDEQGSLIQPRTRSFSFTVPIGALDFRALTFRP